MNAKMFEWLHKPLVERINTLSQAVLSGAPKDLAEYKFLCGEINGLRLAQNHIEDLRKRLEKDDD